MLHCTIKIFIQLLASDQRCLVLVVVGRFTMCLLIAEDTATKSATAVVLLVTRHRVTATGRVELLTELADRVFLDTVRPTLAIGRPITSTSFTTSLFIAGVMAVLLSLTS